MILEKGRGCFGGTANKNGRSTSAVPASRLALEQDSLNGIVTPYVVAEWERLLVAHPDKDFVAYIAHGIRFRIGADQSLPFRSASSNMQSAKENAQVIDDYLRAECRVVGPLAADTPMIHVNRFGVIPKSNQPGKWRLIVDLSHPSGFSVNNGIPRALCSLRYVTVDSAVQHAVWSG